VVDALAAHDAGGATCDSERWRLEAVVERIDAKMAEPAPVVALAVVRAVRRRCSHHMPAAAAISSPATASNVCSASAARAAVTLLRRGGPPPSVMYSPGPPPRAVTGTVTGPVDARWSW
jgi:hypothetical protein